jgi:hypothetical protein
VILPARTTGAAEISDASHQCKEKVMCKRMTLVLAALLVLGLVTAAMAEGAKNRKRKGNRYGAVTCGAQDRDRDRDRDCDGCPDCDGPSGPGNDDPPGEGPNGPNGPDADGPNGYGPGDGEGNDGEGPANGEGYGPGACD